MPAFISFLTSFLTFSAKCSRVFLGFLVKKGFTPAWISTSMGGNVIFCACSYSLTSTLSNSKHKSLISCGHSGLGHIGDCGSGFCSWGHNLFGVMFTSKSVAEFAPTIEVKGNPAWSSCSFFCMIHNNRNSCNSCGHTSATEVVQPPPGAWIVIFVVPSTFIVFPLVFTNSISFWFCPVGLPGCVSLKSFLWCSRLRLPCPGKHRE